MNIKRYFTALSVLVLTFFFLYTFNLNFDLTKQLNIVNFGLTLLTFILWLVAGYLFLVKDILKINEKERNGITLILVLLGIIFFYYNPLPNPENFFVEIPRITFFAMTLFIFISLVLLTYKDKVLGFILAVSTPITVQSFLVNVLKNTSYTNYTVYIIIFLVIVAYTVNYLKQK